MLATLLKRLVRTGSLDFVDARGRAYRFGDETGPTVAIRTTCRAAERRLMLNPRLAFGECIMDGTLVIDRGSIYELLDLLLHNAEAGVPASMRWLERLEFFSRHWRQLNDRARARRNVAHHYDLSGALYALFLDEDRQYSCGYFRDPNDSIDVAQAQKKRHIIAKLNLQDGQRVLDIGCGWGGMALALARAANVSVLGITLSEEQCRAARERAAAAGLSDRVRFEMLDYRTVTGEFDRIVSVGMFEHVGLPNYRTFFAKLHGLLTKDGVALIHAIGRTDGPGSTNAWLRKYIFPGGYSPALSEVVPPVERAGLMICDMEILRLHYAHTLRAWRRRFLANRARAAELYDERFCRMWEFYLAGCELTFRHQGHVVWQMQLARSIDTLPITRDYMIEAERRLANSAYGAIAAE